MTKDDGGSAWPKITSIMAPHTIDHANPRWSAVRSDEGMSLRDWFAGQALAGINGNRTWDENGWGDRARSAYEAADAMIEARK